MEDGRISSVRTVVVFVSVMIVEDRKFEERTVGWRSSFTVFGVTVVRLQVGRSVRAKLSEGETGRVARGIRGLL